LIVPTISGNETRMARNYDPAFGFNVRMDEDHFPPLCMLHAQKAQQAEQRQIAAAMRASKKAYKAMKAMQDIESNAVSSATTVGYGSEDSDDARSAVSSNGNDSSSSKTSPRRERRQRSKARSNAEHAVLDEAVKPVTKERIYEIHLQRELSPKPKPTRCVTPQEKGGKSKSGKGGKSKSRSPKATRHRVE
jgi:hypothetical protein